jgi:hypothetical protein
VRRLTAARGRLVDRVFRRLVDVEWRLDSVVRTSGPDLAAPVPVYYVRLHVLPPAPRDAAASKPDTIDLALSVEQMQDLLLTVREANHQAARIVSGANRDAD